MNGRMAQGPSPHSGGNVSHKNIEVHERDQGVIKVPQSLLDAKEASQLPVCPTFSLPLSHRILCIYLYVYSYTICIEYIIYIHLHNHTYMT